MTNRELYEKPLDIYDRLNESINRLDSIDIMEGWVARDDLNHNLLNLEELIDEIDEEEE